MIVIYHQNNKVVAVEREGEAILFSQFSIAKTLFKVANANPNDLLIWCHVDFKSNLNFLKFQDIFHHHKIMASYSLFQNSYLTEAIGYVDESVFIKVNKKVNYPTWQMSSSVGGIYAEVLVALKDEVNIEKDFDYFLHSIAKLGMPNGLLCYSEPKLLKDVSTSIQKYKNDNFRSFRFVKEHYRARWVFLLFLNFFFYEKKVMILPLITSLFYSRKKYNSELLDKINVQSTNKVVDKATIDVIIPTIGRKKYLYDVLVDLKGQTHLPKKVIIVEQNPLAGSESELDYLQNENWPFEIKLIFTHQAGVCNARNLALNQTQSEWVFLADDDNRFDSTLLSNVFNKISQYGNLVVTTAYPQKNEAKKYQKVIQWSTFGGGNSFVRRDFLGYLRFSKAFEFGYGEDSDFGMKLRNQGCDILYLPEPEILHLKAPIGGFRTKPVLQWHNDSIQPKPSPTVMLYQILHCSNAQINSYKTTLFFKYYKVQTIKNPIKYFLNFQKQWEISQFWANELKKQNEI